MKSVWFFGDSFVETRSILYEWTVQVAVEMHYRYQNFGAGGSGVEYMYEKFEEQVQNFQDGDVVVIAVTSLARTYFEADCPWASTISSYKHRWKLAVQDSFIKQVGIEYQKYTAYKQYYEYLHKDRNHQINLINFLYRLSFEAAEKNLRVIVFACFGYEIDTSMFARIPNIYFVTSSLNYIAEMEFTPKELYREHCDQYGDFRYNHMSEVNHHILARNVIQYLKGERDKIDLTIGYVQGIYNRDNHTIINDIPQSHLTK